MVRLSLMNSSKSSRLTLYSFPGLYAFKRFDLIQKRTVSRGTLSSLAISSTDNHCVMLATPQFYRHYMLHPSNRQFFHKTKNKCVIPLKISCNQSKLI